MEGLITAMITPMKEGKVDEEGLKKNVAYQIEGGVDALLALGSTGEAMTLKLDEWTRVMEIVIAESSKPVIVNVGTNSTAESIERAKKAEQAGADALLVVTPYYVKPTNRGIVAHFTAIEAATHLPIIVYNIPGRTGKNIDIATMKELAKIERVIGVKESSGSIEQAAKVMHDWTVWSGDDALALPTIALGAKGHFSVASNLFPKEMKALVDYAKKGELDQAREIHYAFLPFFDAIFSESNPIGIKEAMNQWGLSAGEPRLPLLPMENKMLMSEALKRYR